MVCCRDIIKSRNFDPESRTLKKRSRQEDVEMEDTVEKNVEGIAEKIIAEDEQKRAQELVSLCSGYSALLTCYRTCSTLHRKDPTGISSVRRTKRWQSWRERRRRRYIR